MRKNISTNTPSELKVGYSRAVQIDNIMHISGTTSQNEKGVVVGNTVGEQTEYILEKIKIVLDKQRFDLTNVISTTVYLVSKEQLGQFDKVFSKFFRLIKPTCTLVIVKSLVHEKLLVEISLIAQR